MKKMMILWAFSLMTVTACSSETERQEPTETEQQTNKDQTMEQTNGNQMYLTLNNGVQMPQFGLGVYSIPAGEVTYNSVMTALKAGYRHIDTAHAYHNERSVGQAVKDSGISRDSIWITSKLWPNEYGEGKTLAAIDRMLGRLGLEYIDLVYFHQSIGDYVGGWREMEQALESGKVRAIGISNFDVTDSIWNSLVETARIKPQIVQIECHPYAQRRHWREMAAKHDIKLSAGSPSADATRRAKSCATLSSTTSPRRTANRLPRSSSAGTCRKASPSSPARRIPPTSVRTSRYSTSP